MGHHLGRQLGHINLALYQYRNPLKHLDYAELFALENWDFGDSFYFSELSSYVMTRLTPSIVNFLIVPKSGNLTFGSLFEIVSEKDQIFINGATIDDIEIISAVTASKIKSSGSIIESSTILNTQTITSGSY